MGGGILVYFGYPQSLERNVEHAVLSALAVVEAMSGLNQTLRQDKGVEIAVRIGISTGMVVVREIVGEGLAQERTVVGEAPNLAARLQGLTTRNGIVIGPRTQELTGDAFLLRGSRCSRVKGYLGANQRVGRYRAAKY